MASFCKNIKFQGATIRPIVPSQKEFIAFIVDHEISSARHSKILLSYLKLF